MQVAQIRRGSAANESRLQARFQCFSCLQAGILETAGERMSSLTETHTWRYRKKFNVAETYEYIEVIPQLRAATHKIFRKPKGLRIDENGRH